MLSCFLCLLPSKHLFCKLKLNTALETAGISVVIPNYNGRQLLEQILPPLYVALAKSGRPFEVILSDDFSTDDSLAFIKNNYPAILLIEATKNCGFSPTINRGIFKASYPFLLLLNSDVKLDVGYFDGLFRYFEKEDTFGVMGRIIGWEDDIIQDGAKYPSYHGAKIKTTGNYIPLEPGSTDWLYSMYLSGANAFVDTHKIKELGGFDELFAPFYVEDYEISLRAWRLGWKCYYHHDAICRHRISVSIKSKNSKHFINQVYYRNKMYLHAMHLTGWWLLFWHLQLIPETVIRIITGRFYYVQAVIDFLKNRKAMKVSMKNFEELARKKNSLLTVQEVVTKITASLTQIKFKRF